MESSKNEEEEEDEDKTEADRPMDWKSGCRCCRCCFEDAHLEEQADDIVL